MNDRYDKTKLSFFFDTANIPYLEKLWSENLKPYISPKMLRGITTNPNAFKKVNMFRLKEWTDHLPRLCELISNIRQDGDGIVYVQEPCSSMSPDEITRFAEYICKFDDGNTKLGLKIPPYKKVLDIVDDLNMIMETNVTGVSDVGTALFSSSYNVNYVSVIPGRMEEVGVNAKAHLIYLMNANLNGADIISGSMRTIEGLKWVSVLGTIPTIGERVWNEMLDTGFNFMDLNSFYPRDIKMSANAFAPFKDEVNEKLSVDFFIQMDECGKLCFIDWNNLSK
jgi:hypothetical protein